MAKRIVALGGIPGSGKTSILVEVVKHYQDRLRTFAYRNVRGLYSKEDNLYIVGIYDGTTFSGTDKLAMNVMPHFLEFVEKVPQAIVLFEGNRLFCQKLFDNHPCEIIVIEAEEHLMQQRYDARGSNQPARFIKAMKTKTANVIANNDTTRLQNNTLLDLQQNVEHILKLIK